MAEDKKFKVSPQDGYILLETSGELNEKDLTAPADAALALSKETGINRLLDDIRGIDDTHVTVSIQAKGIGVMWKLRAFQKVAIIFRGDRIGWLFLSTLQSMHLNLDKKFKGFDNVPEAIAWLKEE